MTPPFAEMGEAGVTARVAIAYLKSLRKIPQYHDCQPNILIGIACARIDGMRFDTLRLALLSLSVAVSGGVKSDAWLKDVCYRDLMQYTLRRCFFDAYKAQRRSPRVTNRGARE